MNFYSEQIIVENDKQSVADFYKQVFMLSCKYANNIVSPNYILSLLRDTTNLIAFRCIDTYFNINNCPSILIYTKHHDPVKNENIYYILMICTTRKFKNLGYASSLLDDFIFHIRSNCTDTKIPCKIALSSIESAVTFYEEYGFKWMRTSLSDHPKLMNYELYEEDKEYFILELHIFN